MSKLLRADFKGCIRHAYVIDHPKELLAFDGRKITSQAEFSARIIEQEFSKIVVLTHSMGAIVASEMISLLSAKKKEQILGVFQLAAPDLIAPHPFSAEINKMISQRE